jgi:hypothetical protein
MIFPTVRKSEKIFKKVLDTNFARHPKKLKKIDSKA